MIDSVSYYFKVPFMIFVMFVSTFFFYPRRVGKITKQKLLEKGKLDIGITRFEGIILLGLFAFWIIMLLRFI